MHDRLFLGLQIPNEILIGNKLFQIFDNLNQDVAAVVSAKKFEIESQIFCNMQMGAFYGIFDGFHHPKCPFGNTIEPFTADFHMMLM